MRKKLIHLFLICLSGLFITGTAMAKEAELIIQLFTVNPEGPAPEGLGSNYNPMNEYEELMDNYEMSMLRFLQKRGVNFIGVEGSLICLPTNARDEGEGDSEMKNYVIIKHDWKNLKEVTEVFKELDFDFEVTTISE